MGTDMRASPWSPTGRVVLGQWLCGSTAVVVLTGELDIASACLLHRSLAGSPGPDTPNLAVDLRRVTFLDCSSLRAFVAAYQETRRWGGCLRVVAPRGEPLGLLHATGLTGVFCVHCDLASATEPGCPRHGARPGA
jgi:anti-anti-sigma factor